jgi:XRE family transcriptional regulator of biofilm formation
MIGEKIRKRRLELKMSQKELADKVGISWQSVSNLERPCGIMPTVATLSKICEVLGLKIDLVYNN